MKLISLHVKFPKMLLREKKKTKEQNSVYKMHVLFKKWEEKKQHIFVVSQKEI